MPVINVKIASTAPGVPLGAAAKARIYISIVHYDQTSGGATSIGYNDITCSYAYNGRTNAQIIVIAPGCKTVSMDYVWISPNKTIDVSVKLYPK